MFVVPKGVEHKPYAEPEIRVPVKIVRKWDAENGCERSHLNSAERLMISISIMQGLILGAFLRARIQGQGFAQMSYTRFIRGKSVLELGCGEGHLTQAVFYKARSVVGIDISNASACSRQIAGFAKRQI